MTKEELEELKRKVYSQDWSLGFWEMKQLITEIERLQSEREWRPIETAPKDGTFINVASERTVWYMVRWVNRPRAGGRWEQLSLGAFGWQPTHWMPLLNAPEGGKE